MKKLTFIFIALLASFVFGQQSSQIEMERAHYKELALKEVDNFKTQRGDVCDDETIQIIQSGIALADQKVNDSIIEILYLKALRFSHDTPLRHPKRDDLIKLSSLTGLEGFIIAELATDDPNWKLFTISTILYGSNEEITDRLIELFKLDTKYCSNIIGALLAGNLTDLKFESIILKSVSSDQAMQVFVAARYLENNPISSALPSLIKQYQRPISSLKFETKNEKVDQSDLWRRAIGQGILSYERDALLEYTSELNQINKTVSFGRLSKPSYKKILKKISKN